MTFCDKIMGDAAPVTGYYIRVRQTERGAADTNPPQRTPTMNDTTVNKPLPTITRIATEWRGCEGRQLHVTVYFDDDTALTVFVGVPDARIGTSDTLHGSVAGLVTVGWCDGSLDSIDADAYATEDEDGADRLLDHVYDAVLVHFGDDFGDDD